ncbi:MAG: hypothetical protein H7A01_15275 [Hahellaceae bacterium]|jgi:hypothetical protein|nr:hypothetical protein [Hahellaceae bacterium]MCP5210423.1 hypothetical protein [Hahellaceae bacterium]
MNERKWIDRLTVTNTLVIEFTSLLILIGSLVWLGRLNTAGMEITWWYLAVPILASAVTLAAFAGNLYVRWLNVAKGKIERHHQLLFGIFCLLLLGVWIIAVIQTAQSL